MLSFILDPGGFLFEPYWVFLWTLFIFCGPRGFFGGPYWILFWTLGTKKKPARVTRGQNKRSVQVFVWTLWVCVWTLLDSMMPTRLRVRTYDLMITTQVSLTRHASDDSTMQSRLHLETDDPSPKTPEKYLNAGEFSSDKSGCPNQNRFGKSSKNV